MAHQWIRLNLAAQLFPLMTDLWGRSIIVPQYDENYERVTVSPADLGKDKGVPQVYYLHNCMPTSTGFQAVGYDKIVDGTTVGPEDFNNAYPIQNENLNRSIFVPAAGKNYVLEKPENGWVISGSLPAGTVDKDTLVTVAFVQGKTYIYYANTGCYLYNTLTGVLEEQILLGLNKASIIGICEANGYMIAFTDTAIAWSSLSNPLDFVPSLVTGAGGGKVGDAKGAIKVCLSISGGFIIYCEKNAVGAKYTGNPTYPYAVIEIPNSGGVTGPQVVSWQGNSDTHFAWTNKGLQALALIGNATTVFSEITEFLSGKVYEDFDEATLDFHVSYLLDNLNIKLSVISDQYLVISYGLPNTFPEFTYALVYDINRQRWGKLKIDHVCSFQWNTPGNSANLSYAALAPNSYQFYSGTSYLQLSQFGSGDVEQVAKTFAFLQADGTVYIVNFDLSEINASGILFLGKYQQVRNRWIKHERTDVENVANSQDFNVYLYATWDGKTLRQADELILIEKNPLMRRYAKEISGINYSLLFKGAFNMTTVLTDFTDGGEI